MPEPKTVSIVEAEERWSGAYEVDDRGVCVMSAYGSDRAPLGRQRPEKVAEDLFRDIVRKRLAGA
jgi:hypothetical protein